VVCTDCFVLDLLGTVGAENLRTRQRLLDSGGQCRCCCNFFLCNWHGLLCPASVGECSLHGLLCPGSVRDCGAEIVGFWWAV
jgi:hypothetical protein